jgi:hypothetical protein
VENDDPQVLSKLTNCLKQCRPTFGFAKGFFRRWAAVRNVELTVPLIGIHQVLKKSFPCAALAHQHQGFIDRYAREPGRESRVFAESLQVNKHSLKRPLHHIFRILLIAKYAESRAISPKLVTPVQFSESVLMS